MKNYPDTTFEQDPTAPWNQEDELLDEICDTCAHCYELFGSFVCMKKLESGAIIGTPDWEMLLQMVEACEVYSDDWCQNYEEAE